MIALRSSERRFASRSANDWDDVGVYQNAFDSYRSANELLKPLADPYVRADREALVGDLIRVYTKAAVSAPQVAGSESAQPVFILGMPRSGTSLVDQIISSHPSVMVPRESCRFRHVPPSRDASIKPENSCSRRGIARSWPRITCGC